MKCTKYETCAKNAQVSFVHFMNLYTFKRFEKKKLNVCETRNIFKKDIQRHSKENIHPVVIVRYFMHNILVLDVD